jgi:hypothetical protein
MLSKDALYNKYGVEAAAMRGDGFVREASVAFAIILFLVLAGVVAGYLV